MLGKREKIFSKAFLIDWDIQRIWKKKKSSFLGLKKHQKHVKLLLTIGLCKMFGVGICQMIMKRNAMHSPNKKRKRRISKRILSWESFLALKISVFRALLIDPYSSSIVPKIMPSQ